MNIEFEGRDVVVTGATGELGSAVARLLAASGARVHAPSRRDGVDLTDEDAVARYYAALPPLWASIHCAGGFSAAPVEKTGLDEVRRMFELNAASAFLCCREAVKNLRGRGGRLVNVASQQGAEPRRGAGTIAYTMSKAAVVAATLALAEEVSGDGIWVNAVVPSIMDTEANRRAMPKGDFARWPKLDEVAATIVFLASPQNLVTRAALVPVYGRN